MPRFRRNRVSKPRPGRRFEPIRLRSIRPVSGPEPKSPTPKSPAKGNSARAHSSFPPADLSPCSSGDEPIGDFSIRMRARVSRTNTVKDSGLPDRGLSLMAAHHEDHRRWRGDRRCPYRAGSAFYRRNELLVTDAPACSPPAIPYARGFLEEYTCKDVATAFGLHICARPLHGITASGKIDAAGQTGQERAARDNPCPAPLLRRLGMERPFAMNLALAE